MAGKDRSPRKRAAPKKKAFKFRVKEKSTGRTQQRPTGRGRLGGRTGSSAHAAKASIRRGRKPTAPTYKTGKPYGPDGVHPDYRPRRR